MKIAIIQFPGSNCERETMLAVQRNGMQAIPFLWNEDPAKLRACDGFIIIGGFSYEDRVRAGIIASLDPLMSHLALESASGKPLLGICNGAQILVESGLIPQTKNNQVVMSLAANKRILNDHILGTGYYNDYIYVVTPKAHTSNAFLNALQPNQPLCIPIAHGEGRFILSDGLWEKILAANIGYLQYCDASGMIQNDFPTNPNGSQYNLAAICNVRGNIMAIMPHPERTTAGDVIFSSMRNYIEKNNYCAISALDFAIAKPELPFYKQPDNSVEFFIKLIINDNVEVSVQKALHNLNFQNVQVRRYSHWEITFEKGTSTQDIAKTTTAINDSCELFNPNKETMTTNFSKITIPESEHSFVILVQDQDNIIGQHKLEVLRTAFGIKNVRAIKYGNLWHLYSTQGDIDAIREFILQKNILFNPCAQDGFYLAKR